MQATVHTNIEAARRQMIDQQIRTWEVLDQRVLDAMERVPRELFVPAAWRELAFSDYSIPIGQGQVMLAPKLHGRILQALELGPGDEVLEVGTGTGYLTACLAAMGGRVRSLEIFPELNAWAQENLAEAGTRGVHLLVEDAMQLQVRDRYDAIALTGSLPVYDRRFELALRPGGRLFAVVGRAPVMEAVLIRRTGAQEWTGQSLFETVVDPLINAPQPPAFVF